MDEKRLVEIEALDSMLGVGVIEAGLNDVYQHRRELLQAICTERERNRKLHEALREIRIRHWVDGRNACSCLSSPYEIWKDGESEIHAPTCLASPEALKEIEK